MPITAPEGKSQTFDPHPVGAFMAVCADVYTVEQDNPYFGQMKSNGKPDTDEKVTKVCIAFLTEEVIEIAGEMKPRYASIWAKLTWGTVDYPSKLREFVKGWFPATKDDQFKALEIDRLIGQGAYLTIVHNTKGDKTYANIVSAVKPPSGATVPLIPPDFVRHEVKEANKAQAEGNGNGKPPEAVAAPSEEEVDMDPLPF